MYLAGHWSIQRSKQRLVEHGACSFTFVALETCVPHRHIQMLEFCRDTQPDLSNFEADGVSPPIASDPSPPNRRCTLQAWPTIIDDFVRWKNARADNQAAEAAYSGS